MAKPSVIGRITRNIVTEPWLVNSSLYSSGLMRSFSGTASCSRITSESTLPPRSRKKNPTNSRRLPMASFWTAISLPIEPGRVGPQPLHLLGRLGRGVDAGVSRSAELVGRSTCSRPATRRTRRRAGRRRRSPCWRGADRRTRRTRRGRCPGSSASMHQRVGAVGEGVELAGELGHPEAVDHVGGRQPQLDPLADRDVHLVGRRRLARRGTSPTTRTGARRRR